MTRDPQPVDGNADAVAIVTDSSACLPRMAPGELRLQIVPIALQIGSEEVRDGIDLEPERLYAALRQGMPVKSAAPSPLDYLDAIEACGDRPVVVITPAAEFTRMHRNATLAAELAKAEVTVLDSRTAAAAHGLVVLAAAEARDRGGSPDDIIAAAEDAAGRADLVACLESVDSLRASGRVPAIVVGLAGQLRLRPVFRLRHGQVHRVALPRSGETAVARVLAEWRSGGGRGAARTAVFHAARLGEAEELVAHLGPQSYLTEFSAAMAIHTGPGVLGVAWLRTGDGEPEL